MKVLLLSGRISPLAVTALFGVRQLDKAWDDSPVLLCCSLVSITSTYNDGGDVPSLLWWAQMLFDSIPTRFIVAEIGITITQLITSGALRGETYILQITGVDFEATHLWGNGSRFRFNSIDGLIVKLRGHLDACI